MNPATIDHLVIAAKSLGEGADFVQTHLGVAAQPGGEQKEMGTHTLLLKLGAKIYLEVIAINPRASKPRAPRWFDLDTADLQAALSESPRLITWVASTDSIEKLAARCPEPLGSIRVMRGGSPSKVTVPADGHLPGAGLVPTLVEWDGNRHPADRLADQGCSLQALAGAHERPEDIRLALAALGLTGAMPVSQGPARFAVRIVTPFGVRTISS